MSPQLFGPPMVTMKKPLWKLDTSYVMLYVWDARIYCNISCTRIQWSSRAPVSNRSTLCKLTELCNSFSYLCCLYYWL